MCLQCLLRSPVSGDLLMLHLNLVCRELRLQSAVALLVVHVDGTQNAECRNESDVGPVTQQERDHGVPVVVVEATTEDVVTGGAAFQSRPFLL